MIMKKGTLLMTGDGKKTYQIIGLWGKDLVLAETSGASDQVVIYGPDELQDLIEEKRFQILSKAPQNGERS
jgi:hypothetical protein